MREKTAYRMLSRHDQPNGPFNGFSVWIFRMHKGQNGPACLYYLSIFMFDPSTKLTRLVIYVSDNIQHHKS